MRRLKQGLAIIFIGMGSFTTIISCTAQQQPKEYTEQEVKQAIAANFEEMRSAMADSNAAKLASYFTEDAFFKLPGQQPVKGREAIRKVHEGMISQGLGIRPSTEEVTVTGSYATELGTVDILGPDGKVAKRAYYLTLWKNVDGEWKIYRDMVSGLPPAGSTGNH